MNFFRVVVESVVVDLVVVVQMVVSLASSL
jgi:hypothetical protein